MPRRDTERVLRDLEPVCRAIAGAYFGPGLQRDDLLQEARIGAWKAIRDFNPTAGLSFRNFANLCITRQVQTAVLTARRRKHEILNRASSYDEPGTGSGDYALAEVIPLRGADDFVERIAAREALDRIAYALDAQLSVLEHWAWILVEDQGHSYEQAAADLGLPAKSIDNAMQRARQKLRAAYRAAEQAA